MVVAYGNGGTVLGQLWALAFFLVFLFAISMVGETGKPFVSSELRFADSSPSGLSIVPASCPSDPHYAGECGSIPPCTAQYYCSGIDLYYRNSSCVSNLIQTCAYGCSGGACIGAPTPTPEGSLSASPRLLRSGATTQISWTTSGVTSCTVAGSNGDSWTGTSGTQTTSPITQQTTYTLSCGGEYGTFTDTEIVNIIPVFEET